MLVLQIYCSPWCAKEEVVSRLRVFPIPVLNICISCSVPWVNTEHFVWCSILMLVCYITKSIIVNCIYCCMVWTCVNGMQHHWILVFLLQYVSPTNRHTTNTRSLYFGTYTVFIWFILKAVNMKSLLQVYKLIILSLDVPVKCFLLLFGRLICNCCFASYITFKR